MISDLPSWKPDLKFPVTVDFPHAADTGEGYDIYGNCRHCGQRRTPRGDDPCLGRLPGVHAACCGHGLFPGYVMFKNRKHLRFALLWSWQLPEIEEALRERQMDNPDCSD